MYCLPANVRLISRFEGVLGSFIISWTMPFWRPGGHISDQVRRAATDPLAAYGTSFFFSIAGFRRSRAVSSCHGNVFRISDHFRVLVTQVFLLPTHRGDIVSVFKLLDKLSSCLDLRGYATHVMLQYIPRNMHTVFALLCFVVVIHWLIFPYPSGLLHWHGGNLTIAPLPAKQPWWIWINTSCEFIMNDCITTTKQSTTKPFAYFLGYTVLWWSSSDVYGVTASSMTVPLRSMDSSRNCNIPGWIPLFISWLLVLYPNFRRIMQ